MPVLQLKDIGIKFSREEYELMVTALYEVRCPDGVTTAEAQALIKRLDSAVFRQLANRLTKR